LEGIGSSLSIGGSEVLTPGGLLSEMGLIRAIESELSSESSFKARGDLITELEGDFTTKSDTTIPFYEFIKRKELSSRTFWQLEELLHLAKVGLKSLGKREIALKRRGERVEILKVPYLPDIPTPIRFNKARERIFNESGYYAKIEEIKGEPQGELPKEPRYKG
jgi:hypothetical protein